MHRGGPRDDDQLRDERRKIVRQIALVEDDDRRDAARPRGNEVPLHARRRKVASG